MGGRFLIASGPVYLASQIKSWHGFECQRPAQRPWINKIIFDRIAILQNFCFFETGNRADHRRLHFTRQTCRNAVWIDGRVIKAFRFQKNLVGRLIGKAMHLIFNRRAVTRTNAGDLSTIDRRKMNRLGNNAVRFGGGTGDATGNLRHGYFFGQGRKRNRWIIGRLHFQTVPSNAVTVKSGRGAGFQASQRQVKCGQRCRQLV